jgi:ubiquinone/menaquinone biosynthesis C-methylase UbiE
LLVDFISPEDSVLEIGCGDSPLLTGMLAAGHTGKLHAIDFSKSIITKVIEDLATSGQAPESITYLEMDARHMSYEQDTWDTIIDKGTLDAMLCDKATGLVNGRALISDACRVLKKSSGTLVLISHIQVETAEFDDWMQSCVLPVLDEHRSSLWKVEAHVGGSTKGPGDVSESPTVYIITSKPRRFTRGTLSSSAVEMSVLSHSDSDEE